MVDVRPPRSVRVSVARNGNRRGGNLPILRTPPLRLQAAPCGLTFVSVASIGVWAHHMYATGLAASRYAFMVFSMVIALGFGIYIYSMIATMWKGRLHLTTPMLFSISVVIGLVYSGMDGFFFGQPATDLEFHSTYFVVGHFHFTIVTVGLFGLPAFTTGSR